MVPELSYVAVRYTNLLYPWAQIKEHSVVFVKYYTKLNTVRYCIVLNSTVPVRYCILNIYALDTFISLSAQRPYAPLSSI